jgi:Pyruvate/2-oxoacid:ferredoxin oxidoreductase delta subunit
MKQVEHELIPGPDINFTEIADLFDSNLWDIGYLDEHGFSRAGSSPVKAKFHLFGYDTTSDLHALVWNGIVLARHLESTNDYSFYTESENLLLSKFDRSRFIATYTNFKESAILSGIGVRAKNSLIYNRKFGFQCKFVAFMFPSKIVNTPEVKPNKNLLDLCEGCNDCIKNCPANAIHEDWVDAKACDHHIDQDIKWFWYEKMQPDISYEEVDSWKDYNTMPHMTWGQGVDGFYERDGWKLKKDGVVIPIPHCRECTLQPRCSKVPLLNI